MQVPFDFCNCEYSRRVSLNLVAGTVASSLSLWTLEIVNVSFTRSYTTEVVNASISTKAFRPFIMVNNFDEGFDFCDWEYRVKVDFFLNLVAGAVSSLSLWALEIDVFKIAIDGNS